MFRFRIGAQRVGAESLHLTATPQVVAAVDADRHGHHLAWGSVSGLNHASPDVELYVGIARRF